MSAKIIMSYTKSPTIHKAVVIINELQFNEIKTMADEHGMLTTFKEEDYDSGNLHVHTSCTSLNF